MVSFVNDFYLLKTNLYKENIPFKITWIKLQINLLREINQYPSCLEDAISLESSIISITIFPPPPLLRYLSSRGKV